MDGGGASNTPPLASAATDKPQPRRRLRNIQKFDTRAFTLHEHCGPHAAAVRDCMSKFLPNLDDDIGPDEVPECRAAWEQYRVCGLNFFTASDWAQNKCADQLKAFRRCSPINDGADKCHDLEMALARCATAKIKLRMSGEKLPEN